MQRGPAADAGGRHGPQRLRGPHRHRPRRPRAAARPSEHGGAAQAGRQPGQTAGVKQLFVFDNLGRREVERGRLRRHLRRGRPGGRRHRRHPGRSGASRAPAHHRRGRADPDHELHGQRQPLLRPGRQVVTSRQLRERLCSETERDVALRVEDTASARHLQGQRPRHPAPVHPHGEHAPRGLRVHGRPAAGDLQGDRRQEGRARGGAHRGRAHRARRHGDRVRRHAQGRDGARWSRSEGRSRIWSSASPAAA